MRIGILTGGGDVPGLNPCIKAVVTRLARQGHEVVGIRRGWGGLTRHQPRRPRQIARPTCSR
jgi:ATP-dependent phosphofructokinase / diphosphate-dependent phosphofructokinase